MQYYSTNGNSPKVSLMKAVMSGLAPDKGLYMPERIERMPDSFFEDIENMSFQEMALKVAENMFAGDIPEQDLKKIVYETLSFDCPSVRVEENIYSLELFHGPTLAFKDVGARFMARLFSYFLSKESDGGEINILVATSGDTGSAVANGFYDLEGINVFVLYPKGKVTDIQEAQFATLGRNVTAVEIDGVFDDCQAIVKSAFMDKKLNVGKRLASANSINVARLLPQAFYYFRAYAQMKKTGKADNLVVSVPSGNFGNITAGLFARRMGLPVKRFIAANNSNDIFYDYLQSGRYSPKASVRTIANAMDVGDPSNFARIMDLYHNDHAAVVKDISGAKFSDAQILSTMKEAHEKTGYILDPHGACAYAALKQSLKSDEYGLFLETAHPAKFKGTVDTALGCEIELPSRLASFMKKPSRKVSLRKDYDSFKDFLTQI